MWVVGVVFFNVLALTEFTEASSGCQFPSYGYPVYGDGTTFQALVTIQFVDQKILTYVFKEDGHQPDQLLFFYEVD